MPSISSAPQVYSRVKRKWLEGDTTCTSYRFLSTALTKLYPAHPDPSTTIRGFNPSIDGWLAAPCPLLLASVSSSCSSAGSSAIEAFTLSLKLRENRPIMRRKPPLTANIFCNL